MPFAPNWKSGLALAALALTTLAGCADSSNLGEATEARKRELPPPPAFATPVAVSEPREGESALAVAARERAGRKANAGRLTQFRQWYEQRRKDYSQ